MLGLRAARIRVVGHGRVKWRQAVRRGPAARRQASAIRSRMRVGQARARGARPRPPRPAAALPHRRRRRPRAAAAAAPRRGSRRPLDRDVGAARSAVLEAVDLGLARGEVDRDVGPRREDPELAHLLGRDPAGGEVGDRARRRSAGGRWRCPPAAVSTGTPTASTCTASEPSSASTMSRSWIIRSSTTSMSRLRAENEPSRCTSTKRGARPCRQSTSVAGLKRSMCPTWRTAPRCAARRDQVVGLLERRGRWASRPARRARPRAARPGDRVVVDRRHGHRDRVHLGEQSQSVVEHAAAVAPPRPRRRAPRSTS